jgi:hypothetical protein
MPAVPESSDEGNPPTPNNRPRGGPRSARGKRRSRANATRHGLHSERVRFTPAEKAWIYRKVACYLAAYESPSDGIRELARQAARALVMLERIEYARRACPEGDMSPPALRLFLRHAPRYQRQWFQALDRLGSSRGRPPAIPSNARNEPSVDFGVSPSS